MFTVAIVTEKLVLDADNDCSDVTLIFAITLCYSAYMLSPVRLSVRHTGRSYKTVEVRIMKFSPYGSAIPLVFREQVSSRNSEGFPQSGGVK